MPLHHLHPEALTPNPKSLTTDVCIYGANSAGIIAALQLARLKRKCILIEPSQHIGGLTAGGLTATDFGRKESVGGLSLDFYRRIGKAYNTEQEWNFEPHVAEKVFHDMLAEAANLSDVQLFKPQLLKSVQMSNQKITSITMLSGLTVHAKIFLDCSYEGDLMAMAGVSYHVGRESNATYNETLNGAQVRHIHQFDRPVSPHKIENDPASGLLPGIEPHPPTIGAADHRVQAYNFRLCLTQQESNRIPYEKPPGYNPGDYELLRRALAAGWDQTRNKFDHLRNHKVDRNNHGPVSTDFIGANYAYPDADHQTREQIFQAHVRWQKGICYYLANDPNVPAHIRDWQASWGLCKDEFTDCNGWSHALYIREARRMISDYIMLEQDCKSQRTAQDPIALGSYNMDSHNCQRFATTDGNIKNDGDVQEPLAKPYAVSYRSITPKISQCQNLLVPVCCSSSHIAYGSIRMEPVFMILAQSAASAAAIALENNSPVQAVDYPTLKSLLLSQSQVLT